MTSKNIQPANAAAYAHSYLAELQDMTLAAQIRILREQRRWTQDELADRAGMKQARISLLESGEYSGFSVATLRKLAEAFDVGLEVSFAPFAKTVRRLESMSAAALKVVSRTDEPKLAYSAAPANLAVSVFSVGVGADKMKHVRLAGSELRVALGT